MPLPPCAPIEPALRTFTLKKLCCWLELLDSTKGYLLIFPLFDKPVSKADIMQCSVQMLVKIWQICLLGPPITRRANMSLNEWWQCVYPIWMCILTRNAPRLVVSNVSNVPPWSIGLRWSYTSKVFWEKDCLHRPRNKLSMEPSLHLVTRTIWWAPRMQLSRMAITTPKATLYVHIQLWWAILYVCFVRFYVFVELVPILNKYLCGVYTYALYRLYVLPFCTPAKVEWTMAPSLEIMCLLKWYAVDLPWPAFFLDEVLLAKWGNIEGGMPWTHT